MRVPRAVLTVGGAALPGALVVLLAFQAGGFFPFSWSAVAVGAALLLALRVTLAERPFAGLTRPTAIALIALGLFAAWIAASASWSHAPGRATLAFDRVLAYGLVLLLLASLPGGPERAAWSVRGLTAGLGIVCAAGLFTRLAPDVWSATSGVAPDRLSYPITYWNGMGLICGVGLLLAIHHASSLSEPRWARVAGAALIPLQVTALYFTFSRGAIAATVIGVVVYLVAARPVAIVCTLLSGGIAGAYALIRSLDADVLSSVQSTSPAAVDQGHALLPVVIGTMLAAAALRACAFPLDARLGAIRLSHANRRRVRIGVAGAAVVVLVALVVAGAPGWARAQADGFLNGPKIGATDLRTRLLAVSSNGRTDQWRVSLDGFKAHPLLGTGAGTYANEWSRLRPYPEGVLNAHSLYLETLGELGLVGIVLLAIALLSLLVGLAARVRGPDRAVGAAAFAAVATWAIHAGVDWDWQLAAVTIWVFALSGAVLAAPVPEGEAVREAPTLGRLPRLVIALGMLILALPGALMAQSELRLNAATDAFLAGDCTMATNAALDSISAISVRPEPWRIVAYCDVRSGLSTLAVRAIDRAVQVDPDSWEMRYSQGLVYGAVRRDPRAAARRALELSPLEEDAKRLVRIAASDDPERRSREARRLPVLP